RVSRPRLRPAGSRRGGTGSVGDAPPAPRLEGEASWWRLGNEVIGWPMPPVAAIPRAGPAAPVASGKPPGGPCKPPDAAGAWGAGPGRKAARDNESGRDHGPGRAACRAVAAPSEAKSWRLGTARAAEDGAPLAAPPRRAPTIPPPVSNRLTHHFLRILFAV